MIFNSFNEVILRNSTIDDNGLTFITSQNDKFVSYRLLYTNSIKFLGAIQRSTGNNCTELVFQIDDIETFITAFLACLLGKIIPVPLTTGNENDCREKLFMVWKNLTNPFLLTDEKNSTRLKQYCSQTKEAFFQEVSKKTIHEESLTQSAERGVRVPVVLEDVAFVQYSSGATGNPKGSIVTHKNLIVNATDMIDRAQINANDRALSWLPLTHDFGLICVVLTNMVAQLSQYIMHQSLFIRRPLLWLQKCSEYKVSLLYTPNFGLQYIVSALGKNTYAWDLSHIRLIYNGAEPIIDLITSDFLKSLKPYHINNNVMYPVYGMAEATVGISLPKLTDAYRAYRLKRNKLNIGDTVEVFETADDPNHVTFIEVGMPLSNCQIRICDDNDQELADFAIGNIQLKGANIVKGYYNNEPQTEALFTADKWLRTGDLGFLNKGQVIITGRKKNMVIINGQNYYPHDIESVAGTVAGLAYGDLIACGVSPKNDLNEDLVIFVTFKGTQEAFEVLGRQIKEKVFKSFGLVVKAIVPIRKFPKTTSGKIQYFKLKEIYHNDATTLQSGEVWTPLSFS